MPTKASALMFRCSNRTSIVGLSIPTLATAAANSQRGRGNIKKKKKKKRENLVTIRKRGRRVKKKSALTAPYGCGA